MHNPLISAERLQKATKVLFIAHLAIGDYQYLQTYFSAFAKQWPHLEIHLWVDEVRRTRFFWKWKHLQRYSLYDWLRASGIFTKIYDKTYSPGTYRSSMRQARAEGYPLVISLATLRAHKYALLASTIAPQGYVVGVQKTTTIFQQYKRWCYRRLDAVLNLATLPVDKKAHITDAYALWFERLVGLSVPPQGRAPFINIPREWIIAASLTLLKWGVSRKRPGAGKIVFINTFAKDSKRCWPLERAFELVRQMQATPDYAFAYFIINTIPESYSQSVRLYRQHSILNTHLFSAQQNFFQLPAMMSLCDVIVSVETAVIHLASALHKPVVALMRQKNPEWAPWQKSLSSIITTAQRVDWIKEIPAAQVKDTVLLFGREVGVGSSVTHQ